MTWRTIDSAPRDGSQILICEQPFVYVGWYDTDELRWLFLDAAAFPDCLNGYGEDYQPELWQPLPEPPGGET